MACFPQRCLFDLVNLLQHESDEVRIITQIIAHNAVTEALPMVAATITKKVNSKATAWPGALAPSTLGHWHQEAIVLADVNVLTNISSDCAQAYASYKAAWSTVLQVLTNMTTPDRVYRALGVAVKLQADQAVQEVLARLWTKPATPASGSSAKDGSRIMAALSGTVRDGIHYPHVNTAHKAQSGRKGATTTNHTRAVKQGATSNTVKGVLASGSTMVPVTATREADEATKGTSVQLLPASKAAQCTDPTGSNAALGMKGVALTADQSAQKPSAATKDVEQSETDAGVSGVLRGWIPSANGEVACKAVFPYVQLPPGVAALMDHSSSIIKAEAWCLVDLALSDVSRAVVMRFQAAGQELPTGLLSTQRKFNEARRALKKAVGKIQGATQRGAITQHIMSLMEGYCTSRNQLRAVLCTLVPAKDLAEAAQQAYASRAHGPGIDTLVSATACAPA